MKTKRMAALLTACALLVFTVVLAYSPLVSATTPPATSSDIEVISYTTDLNKGSGTPYQPDQITAGMEFDLIVKFQDNRAQSTNAIDSSIRAKMNTGSFTRNRNMGNPNPDAKIETGKGVAMSGAGITYTLRFPLKYTGTGNTFTCELSYDGINIAMQQVSITLSNCVETASASGGDTSGGASVVTRGTGFVLKSASYGASQITAGSDFTLNATLLSTNGSYNVENVSVELKPAKEITLANGSSIFYVGTVKPNQSIPVSFALVASAVAESGSYAVTITITGVNANDGTEATASMDITIPIVQPERFEIGNVTAPDYLNANMDDGTGYTSVTLINKGKDIVYNVSAEIVGEGLTTSEGNQFIGNIAAGTESSADFNIMASVPGDIKAQVIVTYENAQGEEKTLTYDFNVTVAEGGGMDGGKMDPFPIESMPTEGGGGMPLWVWPIILVIIVGGVVGTIIGVKQHKKKKAAELEDDEE